jgi:hypothetical protein
MLDLPKYMDQGVYRLLHNSVYVPRKLIGAGGSMNDATLLWTGGTGRRPSG